MYVKVKREKKVYFVFCQPSDAIQVIKEEISKLTDIPVADLDLWQKTPEQSEAKETGKTNKEDEQFQKTANSRGGYKRLDSTKLVQDEGIQNAETLFLTFGTDDYMDIKVSPFEH
eukprot:ctg_781.g343